MEMWRARQALLAAQVETTAQFMPWAVLWTPGDRIAGLLAHLYFSPLQFAEAGNYLRETAAAETAYLAVPGNAMMRGILSGAPLLVMTLVGMIVATRSDWSAGDAPRRVVALALLATGVQAVALAAAVPLAFQRYSLPLVPLVCLWAGRGVAGLIEALKQGRRPVTRPAE
jgi:hypothetical protein